MTSDQRGDSPHAKERRFDELPQRRRRQLLIIAAIRSLASVTVLLTAYFLLPFTRLSSDSSIAQFAVGILIVIVVLSAQTVATLRADYPVLRAVESLATSVPLLAVNDPKGRARRARVVGEVTNATDLALVSSCRPPTAWDALFGCVRAARVRVETAYGRLITRERMAVLCRGSND